MLAEVEIVKEDYYTWNEGVELCTFVKITKAFENILKKEESQMTAQDCCKAGTYLIDDAVYPEDPTLKMV